MAICATEWRKRGFRKFRGTVTVQVRVWARSRADAELVAGEELAHMTYFGGPPMVNIECGEATAVELEEVSDEDEEH